jgi:hypothetical protein
LLFLSTFTLPWLFRLDNWAEVFDDNNTLLLSFILSVANSPLPTARTEFNPDPCTVLTPIVGGTSDDEGVVEEDEEEEKRVGIEVEGTEDEEEDEEGVDEEEEKETTSPLSAPVAAPTAPTATTVVAAAAAATAVADVGVVDRGKGRVDPDTPHTPLLSPPTPLPPPLFISELLPLLLFELN